MRLRLLHIKQTIKLYNEHGSHPYQHGHIGVCSQILHSSVVEILNVFDRRSVCVFL